MTAVLSAPQAGGVQERLKPAAALSLAGYAVGLPLTFLVLLVKHRQSIIADQALKVAGLGGTEATNPILPHPHAVPGTVQVRGRGTPCCAPRMDGADYVTNLCSGTPVVLTGAGTPP